MFSEGGNFSREEIENYRKRLEKTAMSIDKAETSILKEMEKLEKKQLEDATKVMNQFQERLFSFSNSIHRPEKDRFLLFMLVLDLKII